MKDRNQNRCISAYINVSGVDRTHTECGSRAGFDGNTHVGKKRERKQRTCDKQGADRRGRERERESVRSENQPATATDARDSLSAVPPASLTVGFHVKTLKVRQRYGEGVCVCACVKGFAKKKAKYRLRVTRMPAQRTYRLPPPPGRSHLWLHGSLLLSSSAFLFTVAHPANPDLCISLSRRSPRIITEFPAALLFLPLSSISIGIKESREPFHANGKKSQMYSHHCTKMLPGKQKSSDHLFQPLATDVQAARQGSALAQVHPHVMCRLLCLCAVRRPPRITSTSHFLSRVCCLSSFRSFACPPPLLPLC